MFGTNWIYPGHFGNKWQPLVKAVMNFRSP